MTNCLAKQASPLRNGGSSGDSTAGFGIDQGFDWSRSQAITLKGKPGELNYKLSALQIDSPCAEYDLMATLMFPGTKLNHKSVCYTYSLHLLTRSCENKWLRSLTWYSLVESNASVDVTFSSSPRHTRYRFMTLMHGQEHLLINLFECRASAFMVTTISLICDRYVRILWSNYNTFAFCYNIDGEIVPI